MAITEIKLFGSAGTGALDPDNWAPGGVRGPDKVAQRCVYAILTPIGSVPGRPDDGCQFTQLVQGFRSEFDVFAAFAASEPAVANTVRAMEGDDEEDSEKLGTVRLSGADLVSDVLYLQLEVVALDGSKPATPIRFIGSM